MTIKKQRIAVLGAGPMGLAVAYQLALDGYKPIVFEADDRIGGMSACFDFDGIAIERYYHFVCLSDHAFLDMVKELDLQDKMKWVETKMGYWYQNRLQNWGTPFALFAFKGLSFIAKCRYGLHAFVCLRRKNWQALDKINAVQWLRRWCGEEAYDVLWNKLFAYKFYAQAEHISAAWIWSRIRRIGLSRYNVFREKLGYLQGGSSTLLEAMKRVIEQHGGVIHLSSPVSRVVIESGVVCGVEVNGAFKPFNKIISTIPSVYIPKLIPDLPHEVLATFQTLKNLAVVCVVVKLAKALSINFWLNTNDAEMDIPGLVEYSNLCPLDAHIVYIPFYLPGEHPHYAQSDEFFMKKVLSYLKKINPQLANEDFIDVAVNRYRHAQPICELAYLSRLPPVALPVRGLWVADTSYYYPEDRSISESIRFGRAMAKEAAAIDFPEEDENKLNKVFIKKMARKEELFL